jgi:crotonobetaine/carnitine-CoA ligase
MTSQPEVVPTLAQLLQHRAGESPLKPFVRTAEQVVDYESADRMASGYAAGLQDLGIGPGDRVVLLMANSAAQVIVWLVLSRLGAVHVPINPSLTGDLLARSLRLVRPRVLVVDGEFAGAAATALLAAACEDTMVVIRGSSDRGSWRVPLTSRSLAELWSNRPPTLPDVDALAPATMLFTSGSTGVPKACVLSHRYLTRQAQLHVRYLALTADDVLFTPFPLFHIDAATLTVGAALATGATAALSPRFSASRYWEEIRASGATVFNFMGATANILWKQPPTTRDRNHRVRLAWGVPMPVCEPEWEQRFGFPLVEVYGLTDAGLPAYQPLGEPRRPGSCGRIIAEFEVRIADSNGEPVPTGSVGRS